MNTRKVFARIVAVAVIAGCFAGCMNIPAQLNNFSSEVNPLPFPTVQRVVKDAVATSHEPDSVGIISFSPDAKWYDVTLGYLCFTPIAALECGVALVNDALFLPYNLPASIFLHEDGCLTMEEGVIKWKGKVDLYDYDPAHDQLLIVDLKRGNLTLSVEGPPLGGDISFSEPGRHIVRISPPHVGFDEFASDRKNVYFTPLAKQGGKWGEFATIKKSADFVGECYLTSLDNLNAKGEAKEESK
ncbi:MAG: hypothetical protein IJI36_11495 [Kiritimatiellae bacterium]|nr:hypothetical protein [Kiritimatiellia bacterium]MBQ6339758.1 hypothetical protein [Kiritimatiellia bacterium]